MQYKRISADCHLDMPCMPPELFVESRLTRELKGGCLMSWTGRTRPH